MSVLDFQNLASIKTMQEPDWRFSVLSLIDDDGFEVRVFLKPGEASRIEAAINSMFALREETK